METTRKYRFFDFKLVLSIFVKLFLVITFVLGAIAIVERIDHGVFASTRTIVIGVIVISSCLALAISSLIFMLETKYSLNIFSKDEQLLIILSEFDILRFGRLPKDLNAGIKQKGLQSIVLNPGEQIHFTIKPSRNNNVVTYYLGNVKESITWKLNLNNEKVYVKIMELLIDSGCEVDEKRANYISFTYKNE